jgi:hypothetical protein
MSSETSNNTAAERLVEIAHKNFRFGQDLEREPFAVSKTGPNVAIHINQQQQELHVFRSLLSRAFREAHKKIASNQQVTDAMQILLSDCYAARPEPCFRRVGPCSDDGIAIDLGRPDGKTVLIYPNGPTRWHVVDRSPVIFQRTQVMSAMPLPVEGGSLDEIPKTLGLSDRHWTLLLGWILAAYDRDAPHPILAIFGPAGAGKSFLAKLVMALCDPSPCPLRSAPRSEDDWHVAASSSWVYALDNLSEISPWFADSLCKAVTGDARVVRRLYSAKSLTVTTLKLPVIMTAIEVGSLRSDFGDRLVMLELPKRERVVTERQLEGIIQNKLPAWLGALFDAISRTLEVRPFTRSVENLPRMADFCHLLACADAASVTAGAVRAYEQNREDTSLEVGEGDELIDAITTLLQLSKDGSWYGSATELLRALSDLSGLRKGPEWPRAANQLSKRLRRLEPILQDCGVRYRTQRHGTTRRKALFLSLTKKDTPSFAPFEPAANPIESAEKIRFRPDDGSAIPGRYPSDVVTPADLCPSDARTIPERCLTSVGHRMAPVCENDQRLRTNPQSTPAESREHFERKSGSRKCMDTPAGR